MNKSSNKYIDIKTSKLAIMGLGYVGLPLAIEFGKKRSTIGFDINKDRINELKNNQDSNFQISNEEFKNSIDLKFTSNIDDIKDCNIFIVAIPTPVNKKNKPDLSLLNKSCDMIGSIIKKVIW